MKALRRLFVLFALFLAGNILAGGLIALSGLLSGVGLGELQEILSDPTSWDNTQLLRWSMIWQAIAVFILPGVLFTVIFYRRKETSYLDIKRSPTLWSLVLAGIFLFASLPLVNLSYEINSVLPLADWMRDLEDNALGLMRGLLEMDHLWIFILNIILIAVLPALGEELLFRGIVQKQLGFLFKNQIAAIWVAAVIFSAAHFQFEGFLPRMTLGLVLGYLYYWTRNLWIPIFVHFLNNGFQVTALYFGGVDLSDMDAQTTPEVQWWHLLTGIVVMYFVSENLKQKSLQNV